MSNGEAQRPFCSEIARENDEPPGATASRIDHWLLVEYRGLWSHDALAGSGLSDQEGEASRACRSPSAHATLFIRRPDRRHHEGVATYVADSRAGHERLAIELQEHEELRRIDPFEAAETLDEPLFLVCTHGKHDRCCARYGRPLWEGISEQLDESSAWQCTHVGGDRFAGNLVALPHGIYYGRVDRDDVGDVLDHHFSGQLALDRYRGRSCWPFNVQAAERRVRAEEGLTGIADLPRGHVARDDHRWRVRFETRGGVREVEVVEERASSRFTCSSPVARRPRRYVAMPR